MRSHSCARKCSYYCWFAYMVVNNTKNPHMCTYAWYVCMHVGVHYPRKSACDIQTLGKQIVCDENIKQACIRYSIHAYTKPLQNKKKHKIIERRKKKINSTARERSENAHTNNKLNVHACLIP